MLVLNGLGVEQLDGYHRQTLGQRRRQLSRGMRTMVSEHLEIPSETSRTSWETKSPEIPTHCLQTSQLATDWTQALSSLLTHGPHHPALESLLPCLKLPGDGAVVERQLPGRAPSFRRLSAAPWVGYWPFLPSSSYQRKKLLIVNITLKACRPTASSAAIHQPELYSFMVKHFILMFPLLITDTGFKVLKPAVLSYLLGFFSQVSFSLNKVFVLPS